MEMDELKEKNETGSDLGTIEEGGFNGEGAESSEFVTSSPKKSVSRGTMVMFGLLLLAGAGFYFMQLKTGPAAAVAAKAPEAAAAKKTIDTFLGSDNIKTMEAMLKNTESVVQRFLNYPSVTQVPLSDLKTNPFRSKPVNDNDSNASAEQEKKKHEEERLAALKAVQALSLQSVMYAPDRKACMINNSLYREGQQVDEFTVERISATSVVVKRGIYRFELSIQH